MSSSRSFTPPPSGSLVGCHVIYRGLSTSSMEYMSLTHSKHSDAAHMMKGEILISGQNPGYVQYTIVLDHEWMTRKVKLSSMFGGQEKRLVLEVDHDQRWIGTCIRQPVLERVPNDQSQQQSQQRLRERKQSVQHAGRRR
ncbi:hypothetical protein BG004_005552 [Podila humilis]|nr:hypothetical protein BG004_005552 [Podila humilis]